MADGGAICGGVINETKDREDEKKYGAWANAMCYVLPDKWFKKYVALKNAGEHKKASQLVDKYGWSKI